MNALQVRPNEREVILVRSTGAGPNTFYEFYDETLEDWFEVSSVHLAQWLREKKMVHYNPAVRS